VVYYRVSDVEKLVKPPQYVDLNPTEYFILKIVASGRITARDIHETYKQSYGSISRQMVTQSWLGLVSVGSLKWRGWEAHTSIG